MTTTTTVPQHHVARARANEIRLRRAAIKRAVHAGTANLADYLTDPALRGTYVIDVLAWRPRGPGGGDSGRVRAERLAATLDLVPTKMCGQLTERQLHKLREALRA
jgi:hypothetical protein